MLSFLFPFIWRIVLFLLLCSWLTSSPLYAQTPPISAEVDRRALSTDSIVTLTVVVNGNASGEPSFPTLDGFQIVGSSSSTQLSIVNGQTATQATYRYTLQPIRVGNLVIEPISIPIDGQFYSTEPINIQVIQGAAPTVTEPEESVPAPSTLSQQDYFVEAEVDNPTPYLGEQVNYTFRFYHAVRLSGQPNYEEPDFAGFWNEQEREQNDYNTQSQDRLYRVIELKTILFPTTVGERTIEAATLTLPGSFSSSGESLPTEAIAVTVQPPPNPAPADFNGAVGEFEMTATVDRTQVIVDEPITLRVTVQGQGNISTLPEPVLPELADWRAFERTSSINSELQEGILSGSRVDEQLLVPTKAGNVTIPPISYSFFNPKTEAYQTVTSEPIPITVLAGAEEAPVPTIPANSVAQEVAPPQIDIRHIKNSPPSLSSSPALTTRLTYWLAWLAPLVLLLADIGWQWGKKGSSKSGSQRSQAHKKALALLSQASKAQHQHNLHSTISQALNGYLADKLEQPVAGLTHDALSEQLIQKGLDKELNQRVQETLIQCDMGRFAPLPANRNAAALLKESAELISELERSL